MNQIIQLLELYRRADGTLILSKEDVDTLFGWLRSYDEINASLKELISDAKAINQELHNIILSKIEVTEPQVSTAVAGVLQ